MNTTTSATTTMTTGTSSSTGSGEPKAGTRHSKRHLLSSADLGREQVRAILDTAAEMHGVQQRAVKKLPTLRGRTVVNLFFEDSTRTRSSFEIAGKWLSADVINISGKGSSTSKGESLRDTVLTVAAMGVDALVIRHHASGAAHQVSQWVDAHVINAGDGMHEHPTQALLDAYTMQRRLGDLAGRHVVIVGDLTHSRVVRSNLITLKTLGARVTLVAPPTLMPSGITAWAQAEGFTLSNDFDAVLPTADAVMMLRVQRERMSGGFFPTAREYTVGYGLTRARLDALTLGQPRCRHLPPRPDEPRSRDRRRRRRRRPVADPRPGQRGGRGPDERALPPACGQRRRRQLMATLLVTGADLLGMGAQDLLVEDGVITEVGSIRSAKGADVLDADGLVALPGLVDLHTHLREPGREDAETIASGAAAAAVGGFTAVLAMANTDPVTDTAEAAERILDLGRATGLVDVVPVGAVTKGLAGEELAELGLMRRSRAGVTVFSDDGHCVHDSRVMRRALEYVRAFGGVVSQHAQDPHLAGPNACAHEGELSGRLGTARLARHRRGVDRGP